MHSVILQHHALLWLPQFITDGDELDIVGPFPEFPELINPDFNTCGVRPFILVTFLPVFHVPLG